MFALLLSLFGGSIANILGFAGLFSFSGILAFFSGSLGLYAVVGIILITIIGAIWVDLSFGTLGKYLAYALLVCGFILAGFSYLKYEEHEAAAAALAKFNAAQLAQTQADNAANVAKLKQALSDEAVLQSKVDQLNAAITQQTGKVVTWVKTQNDTTLDPIFNLTLQKMKGK